MKAKFVKMIIPLLLCEWSRYELVAELNVTYNYGELFDFHWLDGKKASDTITKLQDAVTDLGIDKDPDYWLPTPGNVGYACNLLLQWAKQYPDIVWAVS